MNKSCFGARGIFAAVIALLAVPAMAQVNSHSGAADAASAGVDHRYYYLDS